MRRKASEGKAGQGSKKSPLVESGGSRLIICTQGLRVKADGRVGCGKGRLRQP